MCRIGYHGSRTSENSSHKLEHEQHHIGKTAKQCHTVYLTLTLIRFSSNILTAANLSILIHITSYYSLIYIKQRV